MIIFQVTYEVKKGQLDEFLDVILKEKIQERFREVEGMLYYNFYVPVGGQDTVFLASAFEDEAAVERHIKTEVADRWVEIKDKYTDKTERVSYTV